MEQRFRRQALYDLVWAEPLVTLAPKLGITGTALANICRRHAIPVPGRGHSAQLTLAKASPRFSLPPPAPGPTETIHIDRPIPNARLSTNTALGANATPPHPTLHDPFPPFSTPLPPPPPPYP